MARRSVLGLALGGMTAPRLAAADVPTPRLTTWDLPGPGGMHRVMTAWPQAPAPAQGFPVFLMLDGNGQFEIAVEALDYPAIICALGYPTEDGEEIGRRRAMDYTVANPGSSPDPVGLPGGGADAFLDFIQREVRPRLTEAPVDPARQALFGHSYGGLFVLHALFTRPGLFGTYVAASPSVSYGDGIAMIEGRRFMAAPPQVPMRLLVTIGGLEGIARPDASPERRAWLERSRRFGRAEDLARDMAVTPGAPPTQFINFPGEDHGSVIPHAIKSGLRFAETMLPVSSGARPATK